MNVSDWLTRATAQLQTSESARLDALLLLEDSTNHDRGWLLAHPEAVLKTEQLTELSTQLARRLQHEPMAYIRGFTEFYGRRFTVNADVLVPRPESESMIALLKSCVTENATIADIGTGSGSLAVTAALETGAIVHAVDIDEACLAIAAHNAEVYTAHIECLQGSLLEPLVDTHIDILLANLPYVPDNYPINDAARHEPALALFAGEDGLDAYRTMFEHLQTLALSPESIITESLLEQHDDLAAIAAVHNYALKQTDGLAQLFQAV